MLRARIANAGCSKVSSCAEVWDVGGQESLRATWTTYLQATDAIIFVVDSNDEETLMLAKMELYNVPAAGFSRAGICLGSMSAKLANRCGTSYGCPMDFAFRPLLGCILDYEWT